MEIIETDLFENPLFDKTQFSRQSDPCILVIFGATGDLTSRKLLPALYNLALSGLLPSHFACVGFARREKSDKEFQDEMLLALNKYSRTTPINEEIWQNFSNQLFYHRSEFHDDQGYESLNKRLSEIDKKIGTQGNRIYYLSTPASFFPLIIEKLHQHNLLYDAELKDKWSRVIIEKPFGHDLHSAIELQKSIAKYLDENQIYRIDHYLGKETVQNLLVFRFGNPIFEAIWNNRHIDHVQITMSEDMGIGTRGNLWEEAGMLRDIVQNHLMQLLSLVCMEPPTSLKADAVRDEKVKVIESIRPFPQDQMDQYVTRGQYASGIVNGEPVIGYRQENNVAPYSNVETYAAMELYIDNWRWAGIPFYLRAGKRLPKRATEIAIIFKEAPGFLFRTQNKKLEENILAIRIQPDEGISLKMNCKVPGLNSSIQPVKMDFLYGSYFGAKPPEAYERLICDCIAGDNTLFARFDEVQASWQLFTPVLEHWEKTIPTNFPNYAAGTWGPAEANTIIERSHRSWRII